MRSQHLHLPTRALAPVLALALAPLVAGCPGAGQRDRDRGATEGQAGEPAAPDRVAPDACGNYETTDAGRKLYAFLQATVWLEDEVLATEEELHETCQLMADELDMPQPTGDTREVCTEVIAVLDDHLESGLSAREELVVDYQPAVCEVDVDAAAQAAAECEGRAETDVAAQCHGTCEGICRGACEGECLAEGAADAGGGGAEGECHGECEGTCQGTCEGECTGYAEVDAEASCEAHAEVRANHEAECTRPEVHVDYDSGIVDDAERLAAAARAIDVGMPGMLEVHARATGPMRAAFETWAGAAAELADAGMTVARQVGDQAVCVAGQLAAAAQAIAAIEASLSVQVEVSASASATAGGET